MGTRSGTDRTLARARTSRRIPSMGGELGTTQSTFGDANSSRRERARRHSSACRGPESRLAAWVLGDAAAAVEGVADTVEGLAAGAARFDFGGQAAPVRRVVSA